MELFDQKALPWKSERDPDLVLSQKLKMINEKPRACAAADGRRPQATRRAPLQGR